MAEPKVSEPKRDWLGEALDVARNLVRTQAFWVGLGLVVALVLVFLQLFRKTAGLVMDSEGYYSHAVLIPVLAAILVRDRWDKLKQIPVKPAVIAIVPILLILYANSIANRSPRDLFMSVMLVMTILLGVAFVAGWRWAWGLALPTLFLLLGLPIWERVIDVYTQPLQIVSTELAYTMLKGLGLNAFREGHMIFLDRYNMYVGVPCSGLRTIIAVVALTAFFILIGKMKWWANLIVAAVAIPLAVLVNGFRIGLIGLVGQMYGEKAGAQFHDYSGMISIVVLVFLIWQLSKSLGMK